LGADDLGYVAPADLALGGLTNEYLVIGGHVVTVLAARWRLGTKDLEYLHTTQL
jgi:hypothetical protein